jgi:hypothetical protein
MNTHSSSGRRDLYDDDRRGHGLTSTDLVLLPDDGSIEIAKRRSTPPDFAQGVIDVGAAVSKEDLLGA